MDSYALIEVRIGLNAVHYHLLNKEQSCMCVSVCVCKCVRACV